MQARPGEGGPQGADRIGRPGGRQPRSGEFPGHDPHGRRDARHGRARGDASDQGGETPHDDRDRERPLHGERPRALPRGRRRRRAQQTVQAHRPHGSGRPARRPVLVGAGVKDLTGTRLGSYEIVERLGGGGMAVVYRAVQQPLGREVALKALSQELLEDGDFVKRFETEAKTLAKLDHPNILTIYDFEMTDGLAYLTMPLVRGGTLRDVLKRGPLDTLSAWRY